GNGRRLLRPAEPGRRRLLPGSSTIVCGSGGSRERYPASGAESLGPRVRGDDTQGQKLCRSGFSRELFLGADQEQIPHTPFGEGGKSKNSPAVAVPWPPVPGA